MQLLGIDFGLRKVGLAVSDGKLAEPFMVIKYSLESEVIGKIKKIVKEKNIEKIIVGISEGEMAEMSKEFGKKLEEFVDVGFADETLTTKDAVNLAIEAGLRRKKRKSLEDAYAATIMLQKYLDR